VKVVNQTWSEENPYTLKVVPELTPGLMNARIAGLKASAHEICVFCDDDNWLCPNYLKIAYHAFKSNSGLGVLGGNPTPVSTSPMPDWFHLKASHFAAQSQGSIAKIYPEIKTVYGAGMIIKKSLMLSALENGFKFLLSDRKKKSLSSGGDLEICHLYTLMDYSLAYSPDLKFDHFMDPTRLSKSYLFRLLKSNTRSAALLYPYIYLAQDFKMDRLSWYKDFFYHTKSLLSNAFLYLSCFMGFSQKMTLFRYRLEFYVSIQKTVALVKLRSGYTRRYKELAGFISSFRMLN